MSISYDSCMVNNNNDKKVFTNYLKNISTGWTKEEHYRPFLASSTVCMCCTNLGPTLCDSENSNMYIYLILTNNNNMGENDYISRLNCQILKTGSR